MRLLRCRPRAIPPKSGSAPRARATRRRRPPRHWASPATRSRCTTCYWAEDSAGAGLKGYDVPHQLVEQIYEDTGVRTAPLRGISFTANKFATETFIDEIAIKRGVDPVKFRLELLQKTPRAVKVVERVSQMANWGRKVEGRGFGFAFLDYSGSQMAGIIEISLDRRTGQIKAHNFWCTIDCGTAVQPDNIVAQTEGSTVYGLGLALSESITIKEGAVEQC